MFDTQTMIYIQAWATEVLAANDPVSNADMLDMLSVYDQAEKQQLWDWLADNDPLLKLRLSHARKTLPKTA